MQTPPRRNPHFYQAIFVVAGCFWGNVRAIGEDGYREPPLRDRDRSFWAFQAPVAPVPPASGGHPIDAFLQVKLQESGLSGFAPEASPETLLRRLSFDLTGLPPSPETRESFLAHWKNDPEKAMRDTIDAFLASPLYGERWAQHWLDVARFAETDGFEHDKVRPEAWRYRDWVVRAFNDDLPYDRFVSLQIAGDLLEPGKEEAVATGFLLSGPDMPDLNLEAERRHNVLNELTGTVAAAFFGITMECAQCHDHKTDPVSQADFYRLRTVFETLNLPKKEVSLPVIFPSSGNHAPTGNLYVRGDFRRPGIELRAGMPRILGAAIAREKAVEPRVLLAEWLVRPEHPLTARVIVNRVWQHHFGRGLVATASDFGKLGDRPTHPELLDWLATELIRHGWSLKWLHREILSSQAWRQSSRQQDSDPEWEKRLQLDPDNHLVSRSIRTRLDGESIRDAMLLVSGRLNLKAGGPGVKAPLPSEVEVSLRKGQWTVTPDPAEHDRRSLYLFAQRNLRYPLFEVFDRPDANQSCARRHVSTTAPQSLTMLNDVFVHSMASALAEKVRGLPTAEAIRFCYLAALGRSETSMERETLSGFLIEQSLEDFCLAIFNLNEFLYVD